ncbi:hypothetical protein OSTOST_18483 [Ostertagia ostertagi]
MDFFDDLFTSERIDEEFGIRPTLDRCTAPLRLQNPLRAEGIYAAYSGNYNNLGSHDIERKCSESFFTYFKSELEKKNTQKIIDPAIFFGMFFTDCFFCSYLIGDLQFDQYIKTARKLMQRQENAFLNTPGLNFRADEDIHISRQTRAYHAARILLQDVLITYVDLTDGKKDYKPMHASEDGPWLIWKLTGTPWTFCYLREGALCCYSSTQYIYLPMNTMRCLYEVVCARSLVFLACDLAQADNNPLYPKTSELVSVIKAGDQVLLDRGTQGYQTIKLLEGLVIGLVIRKKDPGFINENTDYFDKLTEDIRIGGTPAEKTFVSELETYILHSRNCHQCFQLFGLFRIWGYPHVDVIGGIDQVKCISKQVEEVDLHIGFIIRYMARKLVVSYILSEMHDYPPDIL